MKSQLIICIDGMGKDLISKENTPFLYDFGKKNCSLELKTLFAFTGLEYCFFTGENPEKSKIWLEFIKSDRSIFNNSVLKFLSFNKKIRTYFGALIQLINGRTFISGLHNIPKNKLKYFDSSIKQGLWKLDFFKNKKFCFYKWPFFVTENKKKMILKYESDGGRLKRLLNANKKEIYYTQLMEIDKTIHKYGKKHKKTKEVLKKIDSLIEIYAQDYLNKNKSGEIFIWSDHGFADVKNYINLFKFLPNRKDYTYFIAGTTVHFWYKNKEIKKEILKSLKSVKNLNILDKNSAKKYHIPLDEKYGNLIFYLTKNNYFFPNFYQMRDLERFKSMHGYPDNKELNGFLITNKRIKQKALKIEDVIEILR